MFRKTFKVKITHKRTKGIIRTKYFVTIQFDDGRIVEREVPEFDYHNMVIENNLNIVMYSYDKIRWVFNQDEL